MHSLFYWGLPRSVPTAILLSCISVMFVYNFSIFCILLVLSFNIISVKINDFFNFFILILFVSRYSYFDSCLQIMNCNLCKSSISNFKYQILPSFFSPPTTFQYFVLFGMTVLGWYFSAHLAVLVISIQKDTEFTWATYSRFINHHFLSVFIQKFAICNLIKI